MSTVPGQRVVVVGGGIAGLTAAYALLLDLPSDAEVVLLEGAARAGGKLRTSLVAGVALDAGAEAFLVRDPAAVALARELGLDSELVHPVTSSAGIWIDGTAVPIPRGTVMGVPSDVEGFANLLTPQGLQRARSGSCGAYAPLLDDVSIGELVAAQLGPEVVARAVDPLLGGVYAGRAELLSLHATVPVLAAALRTDGSLVAAAAHSVPAPATGPPAPVFGTLRGGLGTLIDALVDRLGDRVVVDTTVRELHRTATGFRLTSGSVAAPRTHRADAVVLAAPAAPAARLLRDVAPTAAAALSAVDYASTALVTLAYPPGTVLPAGSGLLIPADQGAADPRFTVKALTYSAQKWAHLAGGPVLVRASVGRYGDVAVLQRDDGELTALVAAEVSRLTGVTAALIDSRVSRWGGALPQYAVGHPQRMRQALDAVSQVPGLAVAGAAYGGLGIPACVRSGRAAAARVVEHLTGARQSGHG